MLKPYHPGDYLDLNKIGKSICEVICEILPYRGANTVGPDQTPRVMRGVWSGPTLFVANEYLQRILVSLPVQFKL